MPYGARRITLKEKLLLYSVKVEGPLATYCWIWRKNLRNGYGRVLWKKKLRTAHRLAYEEWIGPIPQGLDLDHLCRMTSCINPRHLEPVTRAINVNRGLLPKEFCKYGHPLNIPGAVYWMTRRGGKPYRMCKECSKRNSRDYLARKRKRL